MRSPDTESTLTIGIRDQLTDPYLIMQAARNAAMEGRRITGLKSGPHPDGPEITVVVLSTEQLPLGHFSGQTRPAAIYESWTPEHDKNMDAWAALRPQNKT